jgi:hypothetical protein
MKPSQKELNEFVLDAVEFMGKHFPERFDKTRVAGGNEGVSIRIRKAETGSELEITTDRLDPRFEFGPVPWHFRALRDSKALLFDRILSDLAAVFLDRIAAVSGFRGAEFLGGATYRDLEDGEAVARFRAAHPECDRVVLKKWSSPESILPPTGP